MESKRGGRGHGARHAHLVVTPPVPAGERERTATRDRRPKRSERPAASGAPEKVPAADRVPKNTQQQKHRNARLGNAAVRGCMRYGVSRRCGCADGREGSQEHNQPPRATTARRRWCGDAAACLPAAGDTRGALSRQALSEQRERERRRAPPQMGSAATRRSRGNTDRDPRNDDLDARAACEPVEERNAEASLGGVAREHGRRKLVVVAHEQQLARA